MMMEQQAAITVVIESAEAERAHLDAAWLSRLLDFAIQSENATGIQTLHRDFLNDDTPTDVLSFAAETDEFFPIDAGTGRYLGDIAVSWDTAAAQGPEAGLTTEREVAFLTLHGLLHLLGTDDATDADRAAMHARQHALLDAFLTADAPE